jgi:hypothetical protein
MPSQQLYKRCLCAECILKHPGGMIFKSHEFHGHRARTRARQDISRNPTTSSPQTEDAQPNASAEADILESLTAQLFASTLIDHDVDMDRNEHSPLWMSRREYQEAREAAHAVPFLVPNPSALPPPSSSDHVVSKPRLDHRSANSLKVLRNIELQIQKASRRFRQGDLASWDATLTRLRQALERLTRRTDSVMSEKERILRQLEELHQFCTLRTASEELIDEEPVAFETGTFPWSDVLLSRF